MAIRSLSAGTVHQPPVPPVGVTTANERAVAHDAAYAPKHHDQAIDRLAADIAAQPDPFDGGCREDVPDPTTGLHLADVAERAAAKGRDDARRDIRSTSPPPEHARIDAGPAAVFEREVKNAMRECVQRYTRWLLTDSEDLRRKGTELAIEGGVQDVLTAVLRRDLDRAIAKLEASK